MAWLSFKRALAIFGLCTYCFDVGSDIWVTIDLFQRCHYWYAVTTMLLICMPGFIAGWTWFLGEKNLKTFFVALFGPILMIPATLHYQFENVIKLDSETEERR